MSYLAMPFRSCRLRVGTTVRLAAFVMFLVGAGAASACGDAGTPCAAAEEPASQPGAGPVDLGAGNPINVVTGNKYQREVDLPALPGVLGLEIVRHYNSSLSGPDVTPGALGRGWRLSYETSLAAGPRAIQVMQADGSIFVFGRDLLNPKLAKPADPARGSIAVTSSKDGDAYTWTWNDGRKLSFDHHGRLVQIQAPTGEILSLQHDARGLLVRVTDPQGRSLRLAWLDQDSARKGDRFRGVQAIDTPVGRFGYGYGSAPPKGNASNPVALLANLVSVRYPAPGASEGRRYHYEDAHHPTLLSGISIEGKDANGKPSVTRYSTYAYQADGKAILSTHAGGANKITLAFAAPNQTIVTNSLGQKTVYRHATIANEYRLLEVRGAGCALCGEPNLRYRYDKLGRLTETTKLDDKGRPVSATRIEPDYYGRPLTVSKVSYVDGKPQPAHWQVRYEYPAGSSVAPSLIARPSVVPGKEASVRFAYNDAGQPLSVTESGWAPSPDGKAPPAQITRSTSFAYRRINGRSLLASIDGPLPNGKGNSPADSDVTRYEYDVSGNVLERVLAPGKLITQIRERDTGLRPILTRTSDGMRDVESAASLDFRGMPLTMTQRAVFAAASATTALSRSTSFTYNASGLTVSVTKPDGTTMRTEFDAAGRPAALIDANGNRIDSRFDSEGRLLAVLTQDAQGRFLNGILNLWDAQGRLRARVSPLGLHRAQGATPTMGETVSFDGNGQASANVRQGGQTHILAEDNSTRELSIGRQGMLFIDAGARKHLLLVDDFGRAVLELAPDEGKFAFTYGADWFEKVHTSKDGAQSTRERLEFAGGKLVRRTIGRCSDTFSYEGELLVRIDGCASSHVYLRDAFGQIVEHRQSIAREAGKGAALSFTSRYVYAQGSGQLIERRLPDGQRLSYQYSRTDGSATGVKRDAGWLSWIDHYLGNASAAALRSMVPSSLADDSVIAHVTWRAFGGVAGLTNGNGTTSTRSYDRAGRLAGLDISTPQGPLETLSYAYDGAGSVIASSRNAEKTSYRYDSMQRLTEERDASPATAPALAATAAASRASLDVSYDPLGRRSLATARPDYDAFGRQSRRGRQQLGYDEAHRLVAVVENGALVASYRYDSLGNRIAKTVGAHTTYFLYDTARQLVAEIDENGQIQSQYLYVDNQPVALMRAEGGARTRVLYAIHGDNRGLPLAVTNARREVVWRGKFDAFGNARPAGAQAQSANRSGLSLIGDAHAAGSAAFAMPLRMAGQYADAETGLFYNIHRYYDPTQGRYITPDPAGLTGGEDGYTYVGSDPMGRTDPLGLFEIPNTFIAADPFATSVLGNPLWSVPASDRGHGDILRLAFNQYQRANPGRFSPHTIEWVIRNAYHTDANGPDCLVVPAYGGFYPSAPYVDGGGQCNAKAHFDNPNDGPMYTGKVNLDDPARSSKLTAGYKDGRNDTWISDTLDFRDSNRSQYNWVVGKDISWALSAFGQSAHATADFYAHSNWVDEASRGGFVSTTYQIKDADGKLVQHTECGWVPPGLSQSRLWDGRNDAISLAHIFTGTVAGPGQAANTVCGRAHDSAINYGDIACSEDETTHGYWNKDHDVLTPGEKVYSEDERNSFAAKNLYSWEIEIYNPNPGPANPGNPKGKFGTDWYGDFGVTEAALKKGDRIYVRKTIRTHHQMAMALAALDTQREIAKLFNNSASVAVGRFTLAQVFEMDRAAMDTNGVLYKGKHSKL